jgi:putative ABC transport system substrate-binding protein
MRTFAFVIVLAVASPAGLFAPPIQAADRTPRIGWLNPGSPASHGALYSAFKEGLREHGYIEGKNIIIEERWADSKLERLPMLANELVQLKVDVIITASTPATYASQAATKAIPIVTAVTGEDPVAAGFAASLARPGGNITGLSTLAEDIAPKTLELLHAAAPKATRIAVLVNPANPWHDRYWSHMQAAARILGLTLTRADIRTPGEIEGAFRTITESRLGALVVFADPMFTGQRNKIADLATKSHLPGLYPFREYVEAGGMMSYGASLKDNYRRAASYVDKILKGADPADLPIQQPTRFELVVNLKTARALGISIPQSILIRADEVIR